MNNLSLIQEAAVFGGGDGVLDFGPIAMRYERRASCWFLIIPSYGESWAFRTMSECLDFAAMVARNA